MEVQVVMVWASSAGAFAQLRRAQCGGSFPATSGFPTLRNHSPIVYTLSFRAKPAGKGPAGAEKICKIRRKQAKILDIKFRKCIFTA